MRKQFIILALIIINLFTYSCSLNYGGKEKKFDKMPNFVLKNTNLDRYEENKITMKVSFNELEIYDSDKLWAGKKVYFVKLDKDKAIVRNKKDSKKEAVEAKGYAGLLKIDEKNNKYFLGEKVFFENIPEELIISGTAFFWNKEENILYSSQNDTITIKKGDEFKLKGSGFIANTISREFEFANTVEGEITTETENTKEGQ